MPRPDDWRRVAQYVYIGDGRLWIRVSVTLAGGRSMEWGPRQCPVEWGTGTVGVARATVRAAEIAEQLKGGTLIRAVPVSETVEQFARRYRRSLQVRASTQRTWWACAGNWLPTLGPLSIAALTVSDLEAWQRTMAAGDQSPSYRRLVISGLRAMLSAAHREGIHARNLGATLRTDSVVQPKRLNFTWPDIGAGLRTLSELDRVYFVTLGVTGMRGGELRSALPSDLRGGWLHISADRSKTATARDVPVPTELRPDVERWLAEPAGRRTREQRLRHVWHRAGLPDSPHALRRMCVSELGSLGYRQALVSTLLGHSSRSMTEHYDGARGRQELVDMVEDYWARRVRDVYRNIGGGHES